MGGARVWSRFLTSGWTAIWTASCVLEDSGALLEASWALLGASWALLGLSLWLLETAGALLEASWALLGVSWALLGRSWRHLDGKKAPEMEPGIIANQAPQATRADNRQTLIFDGSIQDFDDF